MSHDLRDQLNLEQRLLRQLLATHGPLLAKCRVEIPTVDDTLAIAGVLHSFYNGIENLFKRVAQGLDEGFPQGVAWHSQLIESMSRPTTTRPAFVSPELSEILQEYMDFRHMFRHAYSFELRWTRMKHLVLGLENTMGRLEQEIDDFLNRLSGSVEDAP